MPNEAYAEMLQEADAAVRYAQQVRQNHRRRTARGSATREADIEFALMRLKDAMRPLKSEIGRFVHVPVSDAMEGDRETVREASASIQRERRKLWKMRAKKRRNRRKKTNVPRQAAVQGPPSHSDPAQQAQAEASYH